MNNVDQLSQKISQAVYQALLASLPQALQEGGVSLGQHQAAATGAPAAQTVAAEKTESWEAKARELEKQLQEAKAALAEKDALLAKAEEAASNHAQGTEALASLQSRFFPDYLTALPEIQPCLNDWKKELDKGDAASPTVLAICSNLFTWSVFCQMEGAEADAAASTALFNFSRSFFEWMERQDVSPHDVWHLAYVMQEAFNERMDSYGMSYAVELPELGCQFEASAMVKSPRSTPGGQDVTSVLAWGLTSKQNHVYKKKSLVLLS